MERFSTRFHSPVYDDFTIRRIEKEFSRLRDEHYLDHAGATLYSDTQIKKVASDMVTALYGNPHSATSAGNLTQEIIENTRYRLLSHFHASPNDYSLVFTSGATATLKIIAETFTFHNKTISSEQHPGYFVYMQDNHTSVLGMRDVVARNGATVLCLDRGKAFDIFQRKLPTEVRTAEKNKNSLFVYSAQCNFSGMKYPLEWIRPVHDGILDQVTTNNSGKWYVLVDAAGFVGTNDLDLSIVKPDFVSISFYKMFGYPTGIGALLVRKSSAHTLEKVYYGGGTVNLALSLSTFHVKRHVFHERFEDGTLPFLSIISLQHGLDAMSIVPLNSISNHVFSLARYLHHSLMVLYHRNGKPIARLYCDTDYEDPKLQGGIVTFNLLRSNGEYVGYMEVIHVAALFGLHLRTGCFCNPGACQRHLGLSNRDLLDNYDAGYTCGGSRDLIDGKPVGAIRISFGYMSTSQDVEALLCMITKYFLDGPEIVKIPNNWTGFGATVMNPKYCIENAEITRNNEGISDNDFPGANNILNPTPPNQCGNNTTLYEITKSKGKLMLARLFIYPIKSCAAYEITDDWLLGERGLQYDREWMIVTSAGICLSQKQQVNLCMLHPSVCRNTNTLTLNYPEMPPIQTRLNFTSGDITEGRLCRSRVCGHTVEGIDCGAEISEWLSLALGRPNLRLIRQNNKTNSTTALSKSELSFSSQAQYLLISEASIHWVMEQISEDSDCSQETILYRFRGNMIVRGSDRFQETTWSRVCIGNNIFMVDGPCTRCQMVCIDQTTGKKTVEPFRLLAKEFHGKTRFGIYLSRQKGKSTTIKIGDSIVCL